MHRVIDQTIHHLSFTTGDTNLHSVFYIRFTTCVKTCKDVLVVFLFDSMKGTPKVLLSTRHLSVEENKLIYFDNNDHTSKISLDLKYRIPDIFGIHT